MSLKNIIASGGDLISLSTEELAGVLFEVLLQKGGKFHRTNIANETAQSFPDVGAPFVTRAVGEAWQWLEHQEVIVGAMDSAAPGWFEITSKGYKTKGRQGLKALIATNQLPARFLEPRVAQEALPLFLKGDFDTAVFKAFKLLEVAIREAAGFGHDKIGTGLAQEAFKPDGGPLCDPNAEKGERLALMSLMAGAIGSYKNPHSHRKVALSLDEARDMLMLASHLIKIVETRRMLSRLGE